MLQNAYFLAKFGADTAENEQHFAEICQQLATEAAERRDPRLHAGGDRPALAPPVHGQGHLVQIRSAASPDKHRRLGCK